MMLRLGFFIFVSALFLSEHGSYGCKDDNDICDHRKYGYRRCHIDQPVVQVPCSSGTASRPYDLEEYYGFIAQKAEDLRKTLIEREAFGKYKNEREKQKEIASENERNVASFAFMFFDTMGNAIKFPFFYFRPNITKENVQTPFFFFSGRKHKNYEQVDMYEWDALDENSIKEEDTKALLNIRDLKTDLNPESGLIGKRISKNVDQKYFKCISDLCSLFADQIDPLLVQHGKKENFFHYIQERTDHRRQDKTCSLLFEILKTLETKKIKISNDQTQYFPLKDTGHFTHSEQYALYKMRDHFPKFIDACLEAMGESAVSVNSYAVVIYTRNTMCVRCASSVITDFFNSNDESFSRILSAKLNREEAIDTAFIAACKFPYSSHIPPNLPLDYYEFFTRQKLGAVNEEDRPKVHDETVIWDDNGNPAPRTCIFEQGAEQMIHHYTMPQIH